MMSPMRRAATPPAGGQQPVRLNLDLGDEQEQREHHERDSRAVRVEGAEREERQDDRDHADDPREDEAWVRELEDQPVRAEGEEQHRDLRVDDEMQKCLDRVLSIVYDRRVLRRKRHRARGGRHRTAIDLGEEVGDVVRLEVDDLHRDGFIHASADAFADRVLGPLLVASSGLGDVDDVRDRVVLRLEP